VTHDSDIRIRPAAACDAGRVSELIRGLSGPFMLSPSGEGAEPFLTSIGEPALRACIASPAFRYWVAECNDGRLAGAAALRDSGHVHHLFVAQPFQGRGLARRFWQLLQASAHDLGNPGAFTVNSSLQAVPHYERFGFEATGPRVEMHGVAFQPMRRAVGRASLGGAGGEAR
jgi:N-acetylglutamate synthase-like GNAT family acetyltransferase